MGALHGFATMLCSTVVDIGSRIGRSERTTPTNICSIVAVAVSHALDPFGKSYYHQYGG